MRLSLKALSRKRADALLDDYARRIVFKRDGFKCLRCGLPCVEEVRREDGSRHFFGIQWAHIHTRSVRSLRWEPLNAMTLCRGCHLWWHRHPTEAARWWGATWPDWEHRLESKVRVMRAFKQHVDMEVILLWLKAEAMRLDA